GELPEAAAMGEALARRPRADHQRDRLVEARLRLLGRDLEAVELAVAIALADAEVEAAAGDEIERRRLLGEQHWIVPGQHDDAGAEPQGRGAHGERREQHQRRRHLVPAGEVVLDQEGRAVAERLGLDIVVEPVAKALAGLGTEILAVGLGRAEETEFHVRTYSAHLLAHILVGEPVYTSPGYALEPRNVRERDVAAAHVHAAELGAAVQRRKHLAG